MRYSFARACEFSPVRQKRDGLVLELRWSEETLAHFPFRFVLRIAYTLEGDTLRVSAWIGNEGERVMPCSIGFHPGFSCPIDPSEKAEDHQFTFPVPVTAARLHLDNALVCRVEDRRWDAITAFPIREGMFDHGSWSMAGVDVHAIRMASLRSDRSIELAFEDFPNLILWAPKNQPITNICIEPWYGVPDAANGDHRPDRKPYTLMIEPHDSREVVFTITCH